MMSGSRTAPARCELGAELQGVERVVPHRLEGRRHGPDVVAAGAIEAPPSGSADLDEIGVGQGPQVLRHGTEGHVAELAMDLAGRHLVGPDEAQDFAAPGRSQSGEGRGHAYSLVKTKIMSSRGRMRAVRVSREEFEKLVEEALELLPEEFKAALDNVAVMVSEEPSNDDLEEVGIDPEDPDRDELFGLYQGVPLTERDSFYSALPDRVMIYRGPILRVCESRREVIREVRDTVQHELGHYFGMDEDQLPF